MSPDAYSQIIMYNFSVAVTQQPHPLHMCVCSMYVCARVLSTHNGHGVDELHEMNFELSHVSSDNCTEEKKL